MNSVADAYARGASAWADGPARVYGPLADELVAFSPAPIAGRSVLDLGSGTGVGSRAARRAGARVVASDIAREMLLVDRTNRPPPVVGDAASVPFRDDSFDVVLACFSLNHFDDPAPPIREAGRVGRLLLASTYANDDDHASKHAVDRAMRETGWLPPDWYTRYRGAMQSWGTVEGASAAVRRAGLEPLLVAHVEVHLDHLAAQDLVAWRLGMAHVAPAYASFDVGTRAHVRSRSLELLGPAPEPLTRRAIFLAASVRSSVTSGRDG